MVRRHMEQIHQYTPVNFSFWFYLEKQVHLGIHKDLQSSKPWFFNVCTANVLGQTILCLGEGLTCIIGCNQPIISVETVPTFQPGQLKVLPDIAKCPLGKGGITAGCVSITLALRTSILLYYLFLSVLKRIFFFSSKPNWTLNFFLDKR